jgi:hypothetical protein
MRAGSAVEKDRVARILFLNLTLDNEKRLSVIWKEPFASLVKAIEMSPGAPDATIFEHLCNIARWLFENQNQDIFRLPQFSMIQRSQQIAQVNYSF